MYALLGFQTPVTTRILELTRYQNNIQAPEPGAFCDRNSRHSSEHCADVSQQKKFSLVIGFGNNKSLLEKILSEIKTGSSQQDNVKCYQLQKIYTMACLCRQKAWPMGQTFLFAHRSTDSKRARSLQHQFELQQYGAGMQTRQGLRFQEVRLMA